MHLRQKLLLNILQANDHEIKPINLNVNEELFQNNTDLDPSEMYRELGGIKDSFPSFKKTGHIISPNTIIVLDDYLHFNRYRTITLRSPFYEKMPHFPLANYRRYCRNNEKECIKSGLQKGIWDNRESDFYFGPSSEAGDFFKNGSGGWKLIAFQDYLEDVASYLLNYKLLRLSVYDNFLAEGKIFRLDNILDRPNHLLQPQLLQYIQRKLKELI